jgi:hypothetical protein
MSSPSTVLPIPPARGGPGPGSPTVWKVIASIRPAAPHCLVVLHSGLDEQRLTSEAKRTGADSDADQARRRLADRRSAPPAPPFA